MTISLFLSWLASISVVMIVSAITSAITVVLLLPKLNHRVELAENVLQSIQAINEKLTAKMSKFEHDMEQHQRDDNDRLREIGEKLGTLTKVGTRIDEAMQWMKGAMLRYEKNHEGLTKQVNELSKQVAVQAKKPPTRKRI